MCFDLHLEEEVCRSAAALELEPCPPGLMAGACVFLRPSGHVNWALCLLAAPLWEWAQQAQGPEGRLPPMSKDSKDTGF